MKSRIKIFIALYACISMTSILTVSQETTKTFFNGISKTEVEILLADVAKTNPNSLKRFVNDAESRKQQLESLKQLFAYASQAEREGIADEPTTRQELNSIRAEIIAVNYDREINRNKRPMPPFGGISDQQIAAYWADDTHENRFNEFLNAKIDILRANNPEMKDREVTVDEKNQARDIFARIQIYNAEYEQKVAAGKLKRSFIEKVNLQVRLQQAQFLSRMYNEKIADKINVTDDEIAKYIAEHSELDTTVKKARAQSILDRVKTGENFAEIANRFSEDPGNKRPNGKLQGGLYVDVPQGRMVADFEKAALALEPGQIAPSLVETDFGYHVIKLERKSVRKDTSGQATQIYDVRHILISTSYKDPLDTNGRDMPVKDYVRNKLEERKEKLLLERLVVENKISVPEDFSVPVIAEKQPSGSTKKARVVKKRPVKKRR